MKKRTTCAFILPAIQSGKAGKINESRLIFIILKGVVETVHAIDWVNTDII